MNHASTFSRDQLAIKIAFNVGAHVGEYLEYLCYYNYTHYCAA